MPIILKRGTESNRPSLFLRVGEPIFTTDTRRLYVGSVGMPTGKEIEFGQLSASFVSASNITVTELTASKITAVEFSAQVTSMSVDNLEVTNTMFATCSQALTSSYLLGSVESASYVDYANVGNKPSLVSSSAQFSATDNVTFGQITASAIKVDTLVVNTISSSVEYVSGSTIHGSLMTNTHQFTGSLGVTGSMSVMGGNVGIGTNNPVKKLDVAGGVHFGIGTENVSNSSNGLSVQDSSGAGVAIAVGTTTARSTGIVWYDGDPGAAVLYTFSNAAPITITGRDLHLASGGAERLTVTNNGNVGIGTTSPAVKLDVAGAIITRGAQINYATEANAGLIDFSGGNARFLSFGSSVNRGGFSFYAAKQNNVEGLLPFTIYSNGVINFGVYGAGTLVTDSSGNVTATSDARMKDISGSFERGLDAIVNLSPKVYHWNKESGLNTEDINVGLIAQEVLPYIPEAVGEKDGRYTMSDRPIIAALINAVKELKADNDQLRARIEALES